MKTELDYIPSQRLYLAVQAVEKEVRQGSKRAEAVKRIAGEFDLPEEELEACLKERRKKRAVSHPSPAKGQTYRHYLIVKQKIFGDGTDDPIVDYSDPSVRRGLSEETVVKKFFAADMKETMMCMTSDGGYYGNPVSHIVLAGFDDKMEAQEALKRWKEYIPVAGKKETKTR